MLLQFSEHKKHVLEKKNGHNGCYDQQIKLRIIHVYLLLSNNMCLKFQVIILIIEYFIAFFVSAIIFTHQERLTFGDDMNNFSKSLFSRKNMIPAV